MARGRDASQARKGAVAALGKGLSRRARSRCELCEGDQDPRVIEVPPTEDEPSEDAALLACALCRDDIDGKKLGDLGRLRFLETAIWSEVPPVQVVAVRLLRRVAEHEDWARETLDGLWLDEDMAARVDAT